MALQDVDMVSWLCEPAHPAWTQLQQVFATVFSEARIDLFIGRKLYGLLRRAGLEDIEVSGHSQVYRSTDFYREQLIMFIDIVRDRIFAQGLLSSAELRRLQEDLRQHLADPGTIVLQSVLFQAWGRKPQRSNQAADH